MIVGGTEAAIYASYCHGCCIRDGVPVPTLSHRRLTAWSCRLKASLLRLIYLSSENKCSLIFPSAKSTEELETCDDLQLEVMLSRIKNNLNALKKYTYGKHIVARVRNLLQLE
ncbi:hypothetical protein SOVF_072820 isoform B, partial [Spinacia oleracea]